MATDRPTAAPTKWANGTGTNWPDDPRERLAAGIAESRLTVDELLRQYCTLTYAKLNSYEATARCLGLDRRTVKSKIDQDLLAELQFPGHGIG